MDITEMQRKYIAHFIERSETLSETEAREFMAYLAETPDAAFRERRISQLERYLRNLEREKEASLAAEEAWMAKAREIVSIKERWEALGASWEERHDCGVGVTTWTYCGIEIMRVWTETTLDDALTLVRAADAKLTELIENGGGLMGAVKVDTEKQARAYEVKYALNDAVGVKALLCDRHRISSARFTGDYNACDILIDLNSAIYNAGLTERQTEAIAWVYGVDLTQKDAADLMGIAQKNVSEAIDRAAEAIAGVFARWEYGEVCVELDETEVTVEFDEEEAV